MRPPRPASPPNGIAQCQPCHQPNFEGGPPAPRLAGLSYEYLVATMRDFAADERSNNGDMPKFMQALSDSERDAMARYLSARFEERRQRAGNLTSNGSRPRSYQADRSGCFPPSTLPHLRARSWHEIDRPTDV